MRNEKHMGKFEEGAKLRLSKSHLEAYFGRNSYVLSC